MSQEQQPMPREEPIRYRDVFAAHGELADKAVAPKDAAMMQTAENLMLGQVQRGAAAAKMQSAATQNERAGLVGHDCMNEIVAEKGVAVAESNLPGRRVITESVGGQVIGEYSQPTPLVSGAPAPKNLPQQAYSGSDTDSSAFTIGEALEATALSIGDKPVEQSDAAAIEAAEMRATGRTTVTPGGVAAAAQSAASQNAKTTRADEKIKLADVLWDATSKMPADKPATRADAEGVKAAEMRNDRLLTTHPAGVAASVAAAARLNTSNDNPVEEEIVSDM